MDGTIYVKNGRLMVHDIFNPLPDFMCEADCVFVDPPYNSAMLKQFYSKAELKADGIDFDKFTKRLFECIDKISPDNLFIEIGAQHVDSYVEFVHKCFTHVNVIKATYYHSKNNKCFIIHGSNDSKTIDFLNDSEGKDEMEIIRTICEKFSFYVIGDLCMGTGAVGRYANQYGREFVGTELNAKRLSILVHGLITGEWHNS